MAQKFVILAFRCNSKGINISLLHDDTASWSWYATKKKKKTNSTGGGKLQERRWQVSCIALENTVITNGSKPAFSSLPSSSSLLRKTTWCCDRCHRTWLGENQCYRWPTGSGKRNKSKKLRLFSDMEAPCWQGLRIGLLWANCLPWLAW